MMSKWRSGGGIVLLVFLLGLALLASKSWAEIIFSYSDVTWSFELTNFRDGSDPTNVWDLEFYDIENLTLPDPDNGWYEWSVTIDELKLDLTPGSGYEVTIGSLGSFFLGTYEAPLAASGSTFITTPPFYFRWEFNGGHADPGDSITSATLHLESDLLYTINALLIPFDNPPYNIIDGSGTASFQITASVIPEPGTMCLTGLGLLGLGALGARRKKRAR